MTILTKETPYNLFKVIDHLYYLDEYNMGVSFKVYNEIFDTFNKDSFERAKYAISSTSPAYIRPKRIAWRNRIVKETKGYFIRVLGSFGQSYQRTFFCY